ncbi:helix-turn-helix domain-containing protein [Microvirga terrae]|uniref:Helix-turn-helix domain-containing protein n=1 Tax=Microvirga terrae TaxID=2740529 RepID=A0ABY5RWB8_9HYPH|nr:helix-turn-helix domain-containing protein [Microvirga terrae]UVF21551.1 helix-turn-helix domain-containing protein [Microvirga terrae]
MDRSPWIALQQWIAASNAQVFIPFAQDLAALIPPIAVRLRRDFKLLLNLIKAHALLHQASRQRDEQGRVVAILEDYATIYGLVLESMAEGVQATISPSIRETVDAVRQIAGPEDTASVSEVAAYLQLDVSSASRRCQTAARRGYLRNEARSLGQTARYVIGDALPQEQAILPTVETLSSRRGSAHEGDCTIADETEGQDPPPLLQRRRVVL